MCDTSQAATREDAILALLSGVELLRARPSEGRSAAELRRALPMLRQVCNLVELEFSDDAARLAATRECENEGSSAIDWIRHECQMSTSAAASAICVGEQMTVLPRSTEAVSSGRIGFSHLAILAGTARALRESPTAGAFDEGALLGKATEHSVSRFRFDCAHARHAADAAAFLAEHVDRVEARRFELVPCGDGGVAVRGLLDEVGGATLRAALEPLARRCGADDHRLRARRLADALVELAGHGLDHGDGKVGNRRPHLQVTAGIETLLGLPGAPAGELEFAPLIPAATVQRLGCDAAVRRILLGPDSAVLDVGRARRVPATATRTALRLRDRGCAWPGCTRPAAWTEAHHVTHWAQGGPTQLENLILLCGRHHWLCHEGGWRVVREADGRLLTLPPLPPYLPPARAPAPAAA